MRQVIRFGRGYGMRIVGDMVRLDEGGRDDAEKGDQGGLTGFEEGREFLRRA